MTGLVIVAIIGGIILAISAIWTLRIAFRESTSCGLLIIFVPFYDVYYAINRWAETKKPFLIGIMGVIALIGGLAPIFTQLHSEVEPVIIEFMEAGVVKDVEGAYACCHLSVSREEVANLIHNNYELFEGFEDVSMSNLSVESSGGITTAEFSGAIVYSGDEMLPFEASLVRENDIWKIVYFCIGY